MYQMENQIKNQMLQKHLVYIPNHKINFDPPEIFGHSNNRRKLRIKETLLIQKILPQINLDGTLQPIYFFNL